jgi:hypothetical protein
MNLTFSIIIAVVGIFGGLAIVVKFGETDELTSFGAPMLFFVLGTILLIWGMINHSTGSYIYPSKTGFLPVSGLQMVYGSLAMIIPSLIILMKYITKKEK